jgi:hypothetical protein
MFPSKVYFQIQLLGKHKRSNARHKYVYILVKLHSTQALTGHYQEFLDEFEPVGELHLPFEQEEQKFDAVYSETPSFLWEMVRTL